MNNVIILMSDEHNPFVSSLYGHSLVKTPNMGRLAAKGTFYRNAYCPSPLCLPSRSAFVSGRRVHELKAYSNCNVNLPNQFPTYGRLLREQGVHTVHMGKTDMFANGEELGFSEIYKAKTRKLPGDVNFNRKPLAIRKGASSRSMGYGVKETAFQDDLSVMDKALDWLAESAPAIEQPWSLTINIVNPHFPQWNTQKYWDMYQEADDLPKYGPECDSGTHPYADDLRKHFEADQFTEEQVRGLRRGYLGNVSFVDDQLGRLLDALEASGQAETTNIIYTSDHGDMLGKFGIWWKCSLYEDSARVPCIAAGPDFQSGQIVETPVDLLDVQASIFYATGASKPAEWPGVPLQQIPDDDKSRVVFSEYHGHGTRSGAYMIRKGDWKLIYYMEAPHQLFYLKDDPDELHNLYVEFGEKARELEAELYKICDPVEENRRAHEFQEQQLQELPLYAQVKSSPTSQ
jgi:choline-sulfatase